MDGTIRNESPEGGGGEGSSTHHLLRKQPRSVGSAAISHGAGNQGGEGVRTCLGREAVLGSPKRPRFAQRISA